MLDTNVLISIYKDNNPISAPVFWRWLTTAHEGNRACSLDKVKEEITKEKELLSLIKQKVGKKFFVQTQPGGVTYRELAELVQSAQDMPWARHARNSFMRITEADPFLIAYAKENSLAVVTMEKSERKRVGKIKIPDVCSLFGVECMTTAEMLENEGVL